MSNDIYYILIDNYGGEVVLYINNDTLVSFTKDPTNTDYQRYLQWVAEGNEAEPWDPKNPPV